MPAPKSPAVGLDFVRLVAAMRSAQRDYFRTRSSVLLAESRHLEKRVDAALKAILDPSLFPDPDQEDDR